MPRRAASVRGCPSSALRTGRGHSQAVVKHKQAAAPQRVPRFRARGGCRGRLALPAQVRVDAALQGVQVIEALSRSNAPLPHHKRQALQQVLLTWSAMSVAEQTVPLGCTASTLDWPSARAEMGCVRERARLLPEVGAVDVAADAARAVHHDGRVAGAPAQRRRDRAARCLRRRLAEVVLQNHKAVFQTRQCSARCCPGDPLGECPPSCRHAARAGVRAGESRDGHAEDTCRVAAGGAHLQRTLRARKVPRVPFIRVADIQHHRPRRRCPGCVRLCLGRLRRAGPAGAARRARPRRRRIAEHRLPRAGRQRPCARLRAQARRLLLRGLSARRGAIASCARLGAPRGHMHSTGPGGPRPWQRP